MNPVGRFPFARHAARLADPHQRERFARYALQQWWFGAEALDGIARGNTLSAS